MGIRAGRWLPLALALAVVAPCVPSNPLHDLGSDDLKKAIIDGDRTSAAELLPERLARDLSFDGWPAITLAALHDRNEVAKLLIERDSDLNTPNLFGDTALIVATYRRNKDLVRVLLEAGADPSLVGHQGRTALWYAVRNNNNDIAVLLLDHGARIEIGNKESGESPLLWASTLGHHEMVRLLIDRGARVNTTNDSCDSPLRLAIEKGHEQVASILRSRGAQVDPLCFTPTAVHNALRRVLLITFYVGSLALLPYFLSDQVATRRAARFRAWICLAFLLVGAAGWLLLLGLFERLELVRHQEPDDWVYLLALIPPLGILFLVWTVVAFGLFGLLGMRYLRVASHREG